MCEGCSYWHGDYHLDILGRSVEQLRREIERTEKVLEIRESYKAANEGYPKRTEEIRRGMEVDMRWLESTLAHIEEHEPRKTSNRRPGSSVPTVKNRRRDSK